MKSIALILIATLFTTGGALASSVCMDVVEMEAALIDWYGETPVDGAWAADQQLWASEASGTWTLMELHDDGTACVLGQGENWHASDDPVVALQNMLDAEDGIRERPAVVAFLDLLISDAS